LINANPITHIFCAQPDATVKLCAALSACHLLAEIAHARLSNGCTRSVVIGISAIGKGSVNMLRATIRRWVRIKTAAKAGVRWISGV
jgi:uncharacterized protein YjaG (DUF416 family)